MKLKYRVFWGCLCCKLLPLVISLPFINDQEIVDCEGPSQERHNAPQQKGKKERKEAHRELGRVRSGAVDTANVPRGKRQRELCLHTEGNRKTLTENTNKKRNVC